MEEIQKLILNEANELDKNRHHKYKSKYSNEYYIKMMLFLLKDVNSWSFIQNVIGYGNNKKIYQSIIILLLKNKFNLWTKKGVCGV